MCVKKRDSACDNKFLVFADGPDNFLVTCAKMGAPCWGGGFGGLALGLGCQSTLFASAPKAFCEPVECGVTGRASFFEFYTGICLRTEEKPRENSGNQKVLRSVAQFVV